jgi:hypothetical protein
MSRHSDNAARDLDDAISHGAPAPLVDAATLDVAQLLAADAAATDPIPNADLMRARVLDSIVEQQQNAADASRVGRRRSGRYAGHARRLVTHSMCALAAFGATAAFAAQSDTAPGNAVRSATRVAARVLHLPQPAPTAAHKPVTRAPARAAEAPPARVAPEQGQPSSDARPAATAGEPVPARGDAPAPDSYRDAQRPQPGTDQMGDPRSPDGAPDGQQQQPPRQPGMQPAPQPQPQPIPRPQPGGQLPPPNGPAPAPVPGGTAPAPKPIGQQPPPLQPTPQQPPLPAQPLP